MKPMLPVCWPAARRIDFPILVSPMLIGRRTFVRKGVVLGADGRPLVGPSLAALATFSGPDLEGYDGVLAFGAPKGYEASVAFDDPNIGDAPPEAFTFYAFDRGDWDLRREPFADRLRSLRHHLQVEIVPQIRCATKAQVETLERSAVGEGFGGVVLRSESAPYVYGRATASAMSYLARARCVAGRVASVEVESDRCVSISLEGGDVLDQGFSEAQRIAFATNRAKVVGRMVEYRRLPDGFATFWRVL